MSRIDHLAYRVHNKEKAAEFFHKLLGYNEADRFNVDFQDGTSCECIAMEPPEKTMDTAPFVYGEVWFNFKESKSIGGHINYHLAPEIFISDGPSDSIVGKWVTEKGPGIHHIAYMVNNDTNINEVIKQWKNFGIKFLSEEPLKCPGLVQIFTEPNPYTGIIYELIERTGKGFCKDNVKQLMESTE